MTKTKLLLSASISAAALAGLSISVAPQLSEDTAGNPFIHPLAMIRSICGESTDGLAERRAFFVRAARAFAETTDVGAAKENILWPELGKISYEISTDDPDAQNWFNQGLAFAYNFNHEEAVKAFRRAQSIDPDCAMCFWGEAFSLGPNINAPMFDEAVAPAFEAVNKALALRDGASEKERHLINALGYRYEAAPLADRSKLDNAFADAMDEVALKYPDDNFIAALAAEANMDTQAWDYWENGGRDPKGRTARTISLIEGILARNPEHTAAIHLYIHITEASKDPYRAADHADRLAGLTPGLGHLIHMPSHTYYRIGRFKQSLDHNVKAVEVDQEYLNAADASILYEYGYFTHNIHFAMTSAQMAGDKETALKMAQLLDEKLPIDMAAAAPWVQPIKAAPYYAKVQFGDPAANLTDEDPGDAMPFLHGVWHYMRGDAYVKTGDIDAANAEVEAISKVIAEYDMSALTDGGVPALDILNIARLTIIARAAAHDGAYDTAVEAMEEAVALQDAIAYTEPPYWYYPAKQTLAAMLLKAGKTERAEALFLESLTKSPNNAFVLHGLHEVYKAQGDKNGAKYAKGLFKDAWLGGKKDYPTLTDL
ncbi:MAG: tetratricopeptide repeat protein [Marinicaulis sp.]|nr:tetratricopeptide repeat protein [Marinicaulis sp.]NNL90011.1 tetratricopeptide repeat protein [Marinicaulis sp.]